MNKSAIQKYAIWARNELRDQIAKRGYYFGIDADGINVDGKDETCVYARDGRLLTDTERKQRNELFHLVKEKGFDQVVEEVGYTWFNRLIALRFMEVNNYLPEHIRVLSNANNEFKPEIKTRALDLEDPHFDKKKILDLIDKNDDEELYRYLLLTECNALNDILPQMFEKIGGYTELLLPNNLLKADSVIGKLVSDIDEADWDVKSEGGQVQIIGWLYQYYNQELKDQTFNDLKKKNKKISKERIPAATQLFTPDWIVRYMVENSLGRMWIEGHPNDELKSTWRYYLEEAEQEPEVEDQLKEIRKEYSKLNPQDIKFLDPAMGSGHILVVAFDILMQIYESQGIRPREAAKSILENNLYGLDIDDRAAQLAYFAVMMKAREYDRRIFSRGIQPNLYSIQESNGIDDSLIDYVAGGDKKLYSELKTLVKEMKDAKEYGSIIALSELDFDRLGERLDVFKSDNSLLGIEAVEKITPLVKVGKLITQKYEIVCTNPPYMGHKGFSAVLSKYIYEKYPTEKKDLYAVFIDKVRFNTVDNGIYSLISQQSWLTLSSFESLRSHVLTDTIISLVRLGSGAFEDISGEIVSTVTFTNRKSLANDYLGTYFDLNEIQGETAKKELFLCRVNRFTTHQRLFLNLPGKPIAFSSSPSLLDCFKNEGRVTNVANTFQGIITGDNDRFLRQWFEVEIDKIPFGKSDISEVDLSTQYWIPYNKGGEFRKWYGVQDYVVNWKNGPDDKTRGKKQFSSYYLKPYVSWSYTVSNSIATRYYPAGFLWDVRGSGLMGKEENLLYLEGLISSKVGYALFKVNNSTLSCQVENILQIPIIYNGDFYDEVNSLVLANNSISKAEWDSFELSWDFTKHPLIPKTLGNGILIESLYHNWEEYRSREFKRLKNNEERLNEIFLDIYGLSKEISKDVLDEEVTLRCADLKREMESLISYAVGCLFGRYSLDFEKVQQSNLIKTPTGNTYFEVDKDNIIPIGIDEYFSDDILSKFIEWIKTVYGSSSLEENLAFIANGLGGIGSSREILRNYFLNSFFASHCNFYKKLPIYWLFDSGKKNGFKCLIYMHRYTPDTLARIRTDYVHEQQERYRSQIKHIHETIDTVPKSEQVKMKKELKDLEAKSKEVAVFEEKLHHLADQMIEIKLDDGVKHNYALFQDVLAKIK